MGLGVGCASKGDEELVSSVTHYWLVHPVQISSRGRALTADTISISTALLILSTMHDAQFKMVVE